MSLYKHIVTTIIAVMMLLLCAPAMAAGLGGIDLDSYLNQPLKARIQLLGVPADQIGTVSARLASADDYRVMGLDQRHLNTPLKFTTRLWRGKTVIEVSSARPVNDPILQFAVDVTWQRGHLLKEFTLFLDPPTVPIAAPARQQNKSTLQKPSTTNSVTSKSAPSKSSTNIPAEKEKLTTKPATVRHAASRQSVRTISESEYGPVRAGETLWSIANEWRKGTGASVNQAMVAIVRLNPRDFPGGNINRMNQGAVLELPSAEDIADIPTHEANQIVTEQISAWREQNTQRQAAPIIASQATVPEAAQEAVKTSQKAADTNTDTDTDDGALARVEDDRLTQVEDSLEEVAAQALTPVTDETPSEGLLELVPPVEDDLQETETAIAGSASGNDAQTADGGIETRLTMAEEDLLATQEENTRLSEQVANLQAEIASLHEGLNLNDSELAAMQQQLAAGSEVSSVKDANKPKTANNKDSQAAAAGILEHWWWLALLIVIALVAWFVYRSRSNEAVDAQVESNFLDSMLDGGPEDKIKTDPAKDEASLAADAERILALLDEDEEDVAEEFAAETSRQKAGAALDAQENAKEEAAEIREFLDQIDADKAALLATSEDALDYADDRAGKEAVASRDGSAEEEIMESLESDDDSASDREISSFNEDHVEVKLDLARAYLAMDDQPAARKILADVLLSGSEQQQLEARSMLDEIDV